MKKQILIFSAALAIASASQAQDIAQDRVPSVIANALSSQFPNAANVEWEKDTEFYKAEFEVDKDLEHEIWYTADGEVVKHEKEIAENELPKAVSDKIKADFKGLSIDDLELITDNGKEVYKIELSSWFKQDWEVEMSADGSILSKVAD